MPELYLLVDYDNVMKSSIFEGNSFTDAFTYVLNKIDSNSDFFEPAARLQHITIRIYGGWHFGTSKTTLAQKLDGEIHRRFRGTTFSIRKGFKVILQASLVYSLISAPTKLFRGTYRKYEDADFRVKAGALCCEDAEICRDFVEYLKTKKKCCYCEAEQGDLIYTPKQKLVDTMICCDLLHLSQDSDNSIALISSDDDLIPPIFQNCELNGNILHVFTEAIPNTAFVTFYNEIKPAKYRNITM
jgi:hypothetical protein